MISVSICNDSKPSSGWIFSLEISLMALAMATAALYWIGSNFCWKDPIKTLS